MKINPKTIHKHQRLIASGAYNGVKEIMEEEGHQVTTTLNQASILVTIAAGDLKYVYSMPIRLKRVIELVRMKAS